MRRYRPSGSHMVHVPEILDGLRAAGAPDLPVVVGGVIPESDAAALRRAGVSLVFTPNDFGLDEIVRQMVRVVRRSRGLK